MIYIIYIFTTLNTLVLGLFFWMFFTGRLKLKTKKLVVIDKNNTERIHLDPNSSEVRVLGQIFERRSPASGMVLFNSKGYEIGGFVGLDDGTTSITIDSYKDDKVSERVSMFVMGEGNAGFVIKDIENNTRMSTDLNNENKIEFKIFDKNEKELKSFSFN